MSAQPRKYFVHYFDGGRSLSVHRVEELVQIVLSHGRDDEHPDVTFLGPTAAHALVEALDHAARDAQLAFDEARTPAPGDRAAAGLPAWGPAFTFGGLPYTLCPAGDGRVGVGQSAVAEAATGRIWHDDCAEAVGAYDHTQPPTSASAPSGLALAGPGSGGADGAAVAGGHPPCLVPAAAPSTERP